MKQPLPRKTKIRIRRLNIHLAAGKVIDQALKGEKINMAKAIRDVGFKKVDSVRQNKIFQDEIETYTTRLERHRQKVLQAMESKDLNDEQYRTLSDAQAKLTHDVQLLTGGKTENIAVDEDRKTLLAIIADIRGTPLPPTPVTHQEIPPGTIM